MAEIKALLNPISEKKTKSAPPRTPTSSPDLNNMMSPRKKAKLTKDAPVFTPGPVRGECRFPPDEYQDEELAAHHRRFEVTPFGEIADYPRHIPYSSEKKTFWEKTNREHLEVFQYTFKVPGDNHTYTMLWDYNIGLVRTTPLFKCTGHSKTTPAKMINRNPGLRDVCHSITGGALVAQGYWIPHRAAKAIAATFCYRIRYALTPVFGHDFPSICIKPDEEGFGDMTIEPDITQRCIEEAKMFREEDDAVSSSVSTLSKPVRDQTTPNLRRQKHRRSRKQKRTAHTYDSPQTSPCASETGSEDNFTAATLTPEPFYRSIFTPINTPQQTPRSVPFAERILTSPNDIYAQANPWNQFAQRTLLTPPPTTTRCSSPEVSPKTIPRRLVARIEGHEHSSSIQTAYGMQQVHSMDWLDQCIPREDQRAAFALLSMRFQRGEEISRDLEITTQLKEDNNDSHSDPTRKAGTL